MGLRGPNLSRYSPLLGNSSLFVRRERWALTWKGWLVLATLVASLSVAAFFNVFHFLAPTAGVQADIVVVEGWISLTGAKRATQLIQSNHISRVIVGGGPIEDATDNEVIKTYAELGSHRLTRAGLSPGLITTISNPHHDRDRTYTEALTIKAWLESQRLTPCKLDIISEGVHARRTRLLFEKAFGSDVEIGIVALPPRDYPADRWWRYSAGVKDVVSEAAGYIYVRFFFWP